MKNAFASILQARPCPTFGRPVRLRGGPHRLRPGTSPQALRIPPRGGHPALRSLTRAGSRSPLAVSGFPLRARLELSIPVSLFGQRGITPAFGYDAPHPSAGGTQTLPINALPGAHYGPLRHPAWPNLPLTGSSLDTRCPPDRASRVPDDSRFHACQRHYPGGTPRSVSLDNRGAAAFPSFWVGRLPRLTVSRPAQRSLIFQPACSPGHLVTFYTEGFDGFVTSSAAPIATGWSD